MESDYLETQYYVAKLLEGILFVQYKPMVRISLEDAQVIVADRLKTFRDAHVPVMIRIGKVKSIDKEARSFLFKEGLVNIKAVALIDEHNHDSVLATFLLGVEPPSVPCKTFDDEQKATAWLRQFV